MYTVTSWGEPSRFNRPACCACGWLLGQDCSPRTAAVGLLPKGRAHFALSRSLLWSGSLDTTSRAQNLRLKKNSRELRLFWQFNTVNTYKELGLFVLMRRGPGSQTVTVFMRTILASLFPKFRCELVILAFDQPCTWAVNPGRFPHTHRCPLVAHLA